MSAVTSSSSPDPVTPKDVSKLFHDFSGVEWSVVFTLGENKSYKTWLGRVARNGS